MRQIQGAWLCGLGLCFMILGYWIGTYIPISAEEREEAGKIRAIMGPILQEMSNRERASESRRLAFQLQEMAKPERKKPPYERLGMLISAVSGIVVLLGMLVWYRHPQTTDNSGWTRQNEDV